MTEETNPVTGVKVDVKIANKVLVIAAASAAVIAAAKFVLKTKTPAVAEVVSEAATPQS